MLIRPAIIDENFLNQSERNDIRTKVLALKDRWKVVIPSNPTNNEYILGSMLPAGMYSKSFNKTEIPESNSIMLQHFSGVYEKLKSKLAEYYQRPVNYHPSLQLPGFHIFSNTKDTTTSYNRVNFHKDAFAELSDYIPVGRIASIIVPIELPAAGGSLVFNETRSIGDRRVVSMETDKTFLYLPGMMAIWSGRLMHSIGPFSLEAGEYRITLQMHVNLTRSQGTVFW
jgi:hypothetical protein